MFRTGEVIREVIILFRQRQELPEKKHFEKLRTGRQTNTQTDNNDNNGRYKYKAREPIAVFTKDR